MDYTKTFKAESKKAGLEIQERVMADLIALGYREQDAFVVSHGHNVAYSDAHNKQLIQNIICQPKFKKYMERTRKRYNTVEDSDVSEEFDISDVSKEQTLRELAIAKRKTTPGSKEWLEINKQIIEVTQMKKDEVKDEENTIHYYLPKKVCANCPNVFEM